MTIREHIKQLPRPIVKYAARALPSKWLALEEPSLGFAIMRIKYLTTDPRLMQFWDEVYRHIYEGAPRPSVTATMEADVRKAGAFRRITEKGRGSIGEAVIYCAKILEPRWFTYTDIYDEINGHLSVTPDQVNSALAHLSRIGKVIRTEEKDGRKTLFRLP